MTDLYDERANPLFERLGSLFEDVSSWRKAVAEHRAVADALAEGDATHARSAMHVHLELTHERFTAAWTGEPETRRRPEGQPA